ncbi:phage tail spike protein [Enterococcus sp. AZ103]|uniref:phage tail spike protein n=1 Tax=Enterococcus sp. AZ103 TaxID=2774628 RepID=UPI003F68426C
MGPLTDAKNPIVDRERNGIYTLSFQYPIISPLFKELKIGRWIVADAGPTKRAKSQKFEIETITKPIDGIVTVYCEHYRYQLLRTAVKKAATVSNVPAQAALNHLKTSMLPQGDFDFYSDVTTKSTLDLSDPSKFKNAQEVLGGVQGSILDNFRGEYVFNNTQVRLLASAGLETNVIIAYGKNLTDITQEENIANTYTSVYGWAKNQETEEIMVLPETTIDSDYVGNYTQRRVLMVDFSEDEPKSVDALRNLVKAYIKNNNIGIPKLSIKTSFEDLASSVLADELKTIETLDLCDTVTIAFNELGINTTAKIIKTSWNVALDKYDSIELGEAQTDFGKVMADSEKNTNQIINKVNWLENAQKEASDILKNPGVGHVVIYPSLADPQEILIMDTTNVNTAKNVWRWNAGGLGFSSTGYNGTYGLAMTNNGAIVADRMTTGILRAINIIGVAISASDITGTNITGGVIKGAQFVQSEGGKSSPLGIRYGQISFYNSENEALNSSNPVSGMYGNNINTETLLLFAGDTYLRLYGHGKNNIGGSLAVIRELSCGEKLIVYGGGSGNAEFYRSIDMHGWSIYNQSDIRLKKNIEDTAVDGISETKKIRMVDFDWRQEYLSKNEVKQPPKDRQFGMIAQYSTFLSETGESDNYLKIDMNKQVNLNTLTNQELIDIVENQEERIKKIEQALNMSEEV